MTRTPTPAPANPTGDLAALLHLPRYTGMDAFAQAQADAHSPLDRGPYVQASSTNGTTAQAYEVFRGQVGTFQKIGIGYSSGYWVVVFNY